MLVNERELQIFEAHEQLKSELRRRGNSLNKIARELGVTSSAISQVGLRRNGSARIKQALADALETTPEALFPEIGEKGDET